MKHLGFKASGRTVAICGQGVELHYISQDMVMEFDPSELAQIAAQQEFVQVTGEMLKHQIQGMPLDEWTDAQRISVAAIVQKLCHACVRAEHEVEFALQQHPRYPEVGELRVFTDTFKMRLGFEATSLARYHLYNHAPTDSVKQRYESAMKFLEQLQKGEFKLLTIPPLSEPTAWFTSKKRTF